MHYRYRETIYHISVRQLAGGKGRMQVIVDGVERPDQTIPLVDDHKEHQVEVKTPALEYPDRLENTENRKYRLYADKNEEFR